MHIPAFLGLPRNESQTPTPPIAQPAAIINSRSRLRLHHPGFSIDVSSVPSSTGSVGRGLVWLAI
jgi:hypothetical protein